MSGYRVEAESSVERAAQTIQIASADFYLALERAHTSKEALRIWALLSECVLAMQAAENAALTRADLLCGSPDYQRGA